MANLISLAELQVAKKAKVKLYECILLTSQYADIGNILISVVDSLNIDEETSQEVKRIVIKRQDSWGKRSLAYRINKIKKANYYALYVECNAETLVLFNKKLRMHQDVIRFLILEIDTLPVENPPIMMQATEK